jgi:glucuronide carrier protein
MRQVLGMVRENRALLVLCVSSVLFLTGWFCLLTVGAYYARDVLGNASYFGFISLVQTVGALLAALAVPYLVGIFGKKATYIGAGAVAAAGGVGVALAPASIPAIPVCLFGLFGLGLGAINTLVFALAADTVEYGKRKSGIRADGAIYSIFSFFRKLGQAIGGAAAAYTIGLGGYIPDASPQPDLAVSAIKFSAGLLPAICIRLSTAAMLLYTLSETRFRNITRAIANRRAQPTARPEPVRQGA